ncbi:MAG: PAS domain-containing protein, partial [Anaerolineaceae bacterium]|nr:PAS domain-containing protein [Anaerolineaceae bacterium]
MLQFNGYVFALIISALLSGGMAIVAFRKQPAVGSREMAGLMLFLSFWSLAAAVEAASTSLNAKITWSVISYITNQSTPVLFLLFILTYTRQDQHLSPRRKLALFLIPLISLGMAATNPAHRLLWPLVDLRTDPILGVIGQYSHGPWFWVEIVYAYAMLGLAVFALLQGIFRFPYLFTLHHRLLLLTALAPWLVSIIYAFLPNAVLGTDMTPIAFTWSAAWLYWGISHQSFLDFIPVARTDILEGLQEGILLFDNHVRLLEANQAAFSFFGIKEIPKGQPSSVLFAGQTQILELLSQTSPTRIDLDLPGPPARVLQLNLAPLENETGKVIGALVTVIDVSEQRKFEDALRASETRYRLLVENQSDGICIVNSQEIFLFANPAAEWIYGVEPGKLVGRNLLDFIPADQIPVLQAQVARRDAGDQSSYILEIVRPDGSRRVTDITAARHDIA